MTSSRGQASYRIVELDATAGLGRAHYLRYPVSMSLSRNKTMLIQAEGVIFDRPAPATGSLQDWISTSLLTGARSALFALRAGGAYVHLAFSGAASASRTQDMKQTLIEAGLSGVDGHWVSSDTHPDVRKLLDRLAPGTLIASRMAWLQAAEHIEDRVLVA